MQFSVRSVVSSRCVIPALATLFFSTAAGAARIEPIDVPFTASGPISFSKGIVSSNCTVELSGRTAKDGANASVDKVTFKGGFKCRQVHPLALPWTLVAQGGGKGKLAGVKVHVSAPLVGGDCTGDIPGSWDNKTSALTANENIKQEGGCIIKKATVTTKPVFKVSE